MQPRNHRGELGASCARRGTPPQTAPLCPAVATAVAGVLALVVGACSTDDGPVPDPTAAPTTVRVAPAAGPADLPEPRTEVAGADWQGRVVVVGGLTADGGVSARVDLYDAQAGRWEAGPALPVGLHHLGLASMGDRLYAAGGYAIVGGQWRAQARVLSLGPSDSSWRDEPPLTRPRGALGLAALNGRLVAVGGVAGQVTATTESWAPGEASWRPGPDLAQRREHLAVAAAQGRLYAIAGRLGGLETNLRSVESWDGAEPSWRSEPPLADARGGTAAGTVSGKPCVAGGEEPAGTIASVECLSGGGWQKVAALREPRHGLAVVGLGSRLYAVAGGRQPGLHVSGTHEVIQIG
jgi:hypothetical protein